MDEARLKVVFLVGGDSSSTRRSIEAVCQLPGLEPVAILLDTDRPNFRRRLRNLSRNTKVNGFSYPLIRLLEMARAFLDARVNGAVASRTQARRVVKQAFPGRCFSLEDVAKKYGIALREVGNLNGDLATRVLNEAKADLGIVLGARILKSTTFSLPRLGSINLHKGKVPEYRGMPPGFWELYDGASSAGITVHFVDKGLDTGDVVAFSSISILKLDTPDTLLERLNEEGDRLLAGAVSLIRDGLAERKPQEKGTNRPRTQPTRKDILALRKKLPHWQRKSDISAIFRDLYLLFAYYSGLYFFVRQWNLRKPSRAAIFLHHRVNDFSKDVLTVDPETFAAQLLAILKYYPFVSTPDIVDSIRGSRPIKSTSVAIHFDDCYRDILTNGAPILKAMNVPACAFVNSGFIDRDRPFPHDLEKYPFNYEKLTSADLQEWVNMGFDLGAHTVNHVDLGQLSGPAAESEIVQCGRDLERISSKRVDLFSYPFGRRENITSETRGIVQISGYRALFSAYGGLIDFHTNPYDIPRLGASHETSPLYCILQIEGLNLSQIEASLRNKISGLRHFTLVPHARSASRRPA